jgi:hypothetical protein
LAVGAADNMASCGRRGKFHPPLARAAGAAGHYLINLENFGDTVLEKIRHSS